MITSPVRRRNRLFLACACQGDHSPPPGLIILVVKKATKSRTRAEAVSGLVGSKPEWLLLRPRVLRNMPSIRPDQPLVPSVLDRLLDDDPGTSTEPARNRSQLLRDLKS